MTKDYRLIEADVLVVGGGMAGLWAAIRAKDFADKVILVEKGKVSRSGVSVFCHGYLAPLAEEMKEAAVKDMIERSAYMADQSWVRTLVDENSQRVAELEKWGAIFKKDERKGFKADQWTRGWKVKAWALGEGKQIMEALRAQALRRGVELVERTMITDLLTSDGRHPTSGCISGAVGLNTRSGQFSVYKAKSVILTTGGASPKLHVGYADNVTGDGQAMAFRTGAAIGGMELAASNYFAVWNRRFTTGGQGQFQTEGARLVNRLGEEFLTKYEGASKEFIGFQGQGDFGSLGQAMAIEILEGRGPVSFDLRAWNDGKIEKMRQVLPFTMMAFDKAGIDLKRDLVESTCMVGFYCSATQSGLKMDRYGETNVRGLYAAGAASMLAAAGLAQALCMVCGYRAGEDSGKKSQTTDFSQVSESQIDELQEIAFAPLYRNGSKISPDDIYYSINRLIVPYSASLFKEESRIRSVIEQIRRIAREDLPRVKANDIHDLVKANEARSFVLLMELLYLSALERKESRLVHYREEYPFRDDRKWIKNVLCKRNEKGGVQIEIEPIEMTYYGPTGSDAIPSPVQYSLGSPGPVMSTKPVLGI